MDAITEHAAGRGSGLVGRSEAGRNLDKKALTLAVGVAVRHNHNLYDELLASGAYVLTDHRDQALTADGRKAAGISS